MKQLSLRSSATCDLRSSAIIWKPALIFDAIIGNQAFWAMSIRDRFQTDPNGPVQNGSKTGRAILQVQFWIRFGPVLEQSRVSTWIGSFPHRLLNLSLETSEISWREIVRPVRRLCGSLYHSRLSPEKKSGESLSDFFSGERRL